MPVQVIWDHADSYLQPAMNASHSGVHQLAFTPDDRVLPSIPRAMAD